MKKYNFFVFLCVIFWYQLAHATPYFDMFQLILNEGRADFLGYLYHLCATNKPLINAPQQLSYAQSKNLCNDFGELYPEVVNAVLRHIQLVPKEYLVSLKQEGDTSLIAALLHLQEQFGLNAIFELWRACKFHKGILSEKNIITPQIKQNFVLFLHEIKNLGLCDNKGVITKTICHNIVDICIVRIRPALLVVQDKI